MLLSISDYTCLDIAPECRRLSTSLKNSDPGLLIFFSYIVLLFCNVAKMLGDLGLLVDWD